MTAVIGLLLVSTWAAPAHCLDESCYLPLAHNELMMEERGARQGNWPHDGGSLFAFAGVALLARVALLRKDREGGK